MFGFLGARAVQGIETFSEGAYTRSFPWRATRADHGRPDDAAQGMRVTLSAGLAAGRG
jgi:DNA-3-methyladenine glycosylase II